MKTYLLAAAFLLIAFQNSYSEDRFYIAHRQWVSAITASPSGDTLISIDNDGELIITNRILSELIFKGLLDELKWGNDALSCAFIPSRGIVAIGTIEGYLLLFDVNQDKVISYTKIFTGNPNGNSLGRIVVANDNSRLLLSSYCWWGESNVVHEYDINSQSLVASYQFATGVTGLALDASGTTMYTTHMDGSLIATRYPEGTRVNSIDISYHGIYSLTQDDSRRFLAIHNLISPQNIRIYDIAAIAMQTTSVNLWGTGVCLSDGGEFVYAVKNEQLIKCRVASGISIIRPMRDDLYANARLMCLPDNELLVSTETKVARYDANTLNLLGHYREDSGEMRFAQYYNSNKLLIMGINLAESQGSVLKAYNMSENAPGVSLYSDSMNINSISVSPDEQSAMLSYSNNYSRSEIIIVSMNGFTEQTRLRGLPVNTLGYYNNDAECTLIDQSGNASRRRIGSWEVLKTNKYDPNLYKLETSKSNNLVLQYTGYYMVINRTNDKMIDLLFKTSNVSLCDNDEIIRRVDTTNSFIRYNPNVSPADTHLYHANSQRAYCASHDPASGLTMINASGTIEVIAKSDSVPYSSRQYIEQEVRKSYIDTEGQFIVCLHVDNFVSRINIQDLILDIENETDGRKLKEMNITLSPQPAENIVTVHTGSEADGTARIMIASLTGQTISSENKTLHHGNMSIDVSSLHSGAYYIIVAYQDNVHIQKMLVTR